MHRTVALLGIAVLAACADSLPVELNGVSTPQLNVTAGASATVRHVVVLRSTPRSDFVRSVAARGGTIELLHEGAGIAIVAGLSPENARAVEKHAGVETMIEDFEYQVVSHHVTPETMDAGSAAETQSQDNPAGATFFAVQWHHRAIGAHIAWANQRVGSSSVDVAILDSGIDHLYRDLVGLVDVSRAASFVPTNGTNPLAPTDDQLLAAFFPGSGRPIWSDLNGHGTHVASTVSSLGIGFAGVTSNVTLIPVKVLNASGSGSFGAIVNGILHATDVDADVINMSLGALFFRRGNHAFTKALDRVTKFATDAGVTIVVAAGNEAIDLHPSNKAAVDLSPSNNPVYGAFCSTKNVICVSATGPNLVVNNAGVQTPFGPNFLPSVDLVAFYTNSGQQFIDVAAPGGNWIENEQGVAVSGGWVWAACSKTGLVRHTPPPPATPFWEKGSCANNPSANFIIGLGGTSMASPHVAGLAALLVEDLGRNPQAIKETIRRTADDIRGEFGGKPGTDDFYGRGRINVPRALGL